MDLKTRNNIIDEYVVPYLEQQEGYYNVVPKQKGLPRCIDLQCKKDGVNYFFSIMVVTPDKKGRCFDATVSTEWIEAQKRGENFKFILCCVDSSQQLKTVKILEKESVLSYSLPHPTSFQIKLNINEDEIANPQMASKDRMDSLYKMIEDFERLKNEYSNKF